MKHHDLEHPAGRGASKGRLQHRYLKAFSASLLALGIAEVQAQDTAMLEEIVVTATKRATSLQDTALGITSTSGDTLAKNQTFDMESFARLDPSVQINNRGIGDNQIIVRGISSAGKPTVGVYYDEAVITGLGLDGGSDNQPNIGMHDVNRVEILKGPQGTLFGANSMSGTVRIISNKPDLTEFEGKVSGSAASIKDGNPFYRGEAMVNLPIIEDKLGVRLVAWGDSGGGYIDKITDNGEDKDVNDQLIKGGKIMIGLQPTERLNMNLSVLRQTSEADDSQYFEFSEGPYNNVSPTSEPFEDEIDLYSLEINYDLDFGTVSASTSYLKREMMLSRDSTPTAIRFGIPALLSYNQDQEFSNWSSEVRFASDFSGPFQFVSGVFYSEQDSDTRNAALVADPVSMEPPCDFHSDCVSSGNAAADINSGTGSSNIDQLAVFLESTYDFTDRLTGVFGIRYYEADLDEVRISTQGLRFPTSPVQTEDELQLDASSSEDEISYNVAVNYAITDNTTLYARAASGFRPGGVNDSANAADYGVTVPAGYEADELWNYEVGAKSYLLDQRVYAEFTLYRIDWDKQQISVTDPGGTFVYIANAGKSVVNGAEAMINASFDNGLSGNLAVTFTDSSLSEDLPNTAETSGYDGDRLPYTARWAMSGQLEYEFPMDWFDSTGYVNTNFNFRDDSYTAFNSDDDNYAKLDSYLLVGLRAGMRTDSWEAGLFVDNLTDEAPEIGLRVTGDGYRVYTTRPRTIGLTYSLRF